MLGADLLPSVAQGLLPPVLLSRRLVKEAFARADEYMKTHQSMDDIPIVNADSLLINAKSKTLQKLCLRDLGFNVEALKNMLDANVGDSIVSVLLTLVLSLFAGIGLFILAHFPALVFPMVICTFLPFWPGVYTCLSCSRLSHKTDARRLNLGLVLLTTETTLLTTETNICPESKDDE